MGLAAAWDSDVGGSSVVLDESARQHAEVRLLEAGTRAQLDGAVEQPGVVDGAWTAQGTTAVWIDVRVTGR